MKRFFIAFREALSGKPLSVRSSKWESVRKHHILANPLCAACGGSIKPQVHHIKPFHLYRELELEPTNLITLCEHGKTECHLKIGHLGNFKRENINVVADAAASLLLVKSI